MLKQLFIFIFIVQTLLFADTFKWESNKHASPIKNPLKSISLLVEKDMADFIYAKKPIDLRSSIPPEVQKPPLPTEIKKPLLPPTIKLTRGEFETTKAFKQRVLKRSNLRDKKLQQIEAKYRAEVQQRNKRIEKIVYDYNNKIKERNAILKTLQKRQKNNADQLKKHYALQKEIARTQMGTYASKAVSTIYGQPKLSYKSYDPDTASMRLIVTSYDRHNFQKNITIKIPPSKAKIFKHDIATLTPKVLFDISMGDKEELNFSIKKISINHKGTLYLANDTTSFSVAVPVQVTIDNRATDFSTQESDFTIQKSNTKFALQDPDLSNSFSLGAVAVTADGAIIGVNELLNTIETLPSSKKDPHKWLFMIAIEDYDETDDVMYANRSAVALKSIMQKRFGIMEKHTYALFGTKATSGAIKDKLRAMIARVKKSDTIYFYYSGHGIPSKNGDAFILPKDKVVDFIEHDTFFKLGKIYGMLGASRAKHSFVFVDACFSGKTDNKLLFKGVAPGLIKSKQARYDKKKMTIITAGLDNEFSNMYEEKKYRLFSYYLTEALIDDINDISLLYKKVNLGVLEKSRELGSRYEQNPQIYGNKSMKLY